MTELQKIAVKKFSSVPEEARAFVLALIQELEDYLLAHGFTQIQTEKILSNAVKFSKENDVYSLLGEFYTAKKDPRDLLR